MDGLNPLLQNVENVVLTNVLFWESNQRQNLNHFQFILENLLFGVGGDPRCEGVIGRYVHFIGKSLDYYHYYLHMLSDWLTNYVEQSPSSESNRPSAGQQIPRILWNPKVHYRIQNSPPTVRILSQIEPVRAPQPHFSKIHFNIILAAISGSYKWSPTLGVSYQNLLCISPICYMPCVPHSSLFVHSNA